MSKTPETDAAFGRNALSSFANFARTLETQRDEARAELLAERKRVGDAATLNMRLAHEKQGAEVALIEARDEDVKAYVATGLFDSPAQAKEIIAAKDARIAELEDYIHTIRPKADCYDRVCQTLGIESDIIGHVKRLEAQLATSPWRPMSEAPTEEDADATGCVLCANTSGVICRRHIDRWEAKTLESHLLAWMPVPKFHGWPDPLADLLKVHGVEVTQELTAALNAWKGVEK